MTAGGSDGVDVDDRAPAIEVVEYGLKRRVAQPSAPVIRQNPDTIRLERVEDVLDLAKTCVYVRQR
jgi:hypothetical protein